MTFYLLSGVLISTKCGRFKRIEPFQLIMFLFRELITSISSTKDTVYAFQVVHNEYISIYIWNKYIQRCRHNKIFLSSLISLPITS